MIIFSLNPQLLQGRNSFETNLQLAPQMRLVDATGVRDSLATRRNTGARTGTHAGTRGHLGTLGAGRVRAGGGGGG